MFSAGAVDSTTISGMLKYVYTPEAIVQQQNQMTITWPKLSKSPLKPAGLGFVGAALLAGNQQGLGSQNELENLRPSGSQTVLQYLVLPKILTDTIRLSGLSLEIAKGNEDSFANNLTFQMEGAIQDATKELNGQLFRDGSGTLGLLNGAAVAATVITVDNPGIQWFKMNEFIDIFNAAGTVKQASNVQIIDFDFEANTLTLLTAVTADDNGIIVRTGVRDNMPVGGKELAGLPLATDDGTLSAMYENIPRTGGSAQPNWRGIVFDAGNASLTNDMLQRQVMRSKVRGAEDFDYIITHPQQTRKYLDIVTPLKRYVNTDEKLDSGYKTAEWNGKNWIEDTDCPYNDLYMFNSKFFKKFSVYELKFDDTNGNVAKWDPSFDAFIVYAKTYMNTGTNCPRNLVRITNLNVPAF